MFFTRLRLSQPLDVGQHLDMNKVGDYSEMLMAPVDSDWDEIIWTRCNFHVIEASSISLHSAALASSRRGADGNYVNTNVSTNKETSCTGLRASKSNNIVEEWFVNLVSN